MDVIPVFISLLWLIVGSYFDIFKKRVIPEWLSYSFLIVSFLYFMLSGFVLSSIVLPVIILVVGYFSYRMGYLGGADVLYLASISLLFPMDGLMNIPLVIVIIFVASLLLSMYLIAHTLISVKSLSPDTSSKITALIWIVGYSVVSYLLYNMGFQSMSYLTLVVGIVSALYSLIRKDMMEHLVIWTPVEELIEEDIIAVDRFPEFKEKYGLNRLLTRDMLSKLKKSDIKKVPVYNLPPYLPFLLLALVTIFLLF